MEFFYYGLLIAAVVVALNAWIIIKRKNLGAFIRNIWHWIISCPVNAGWAALFFAGVIVILSTQHLYNDGAPFWDGVAVEAHGMLMDIIVLGIFVLWLNKHREMRAEDRARQREREALIQRYNEEIDDFRHWNNKESMQRIVGGIRRLNRLEIANIALHYCYLKGANLRGADLRGANLKDANLEGAILWEANLEGAILKGARLKSTDFTSANLQGALLQDANLRCAVLREADLTGANLRGADLRSANLRDVYLEGAALVRADLRGTNLKCAALFQTNLGGADLRGANLKHASLQSAFLGGTNLKRVDLWETDLYSAQYSLQTKFPNNFKLGRHGMILVDRYRKPLTASLDND